MPFSGRSVIMKRTPCVAVLILLSLAAGCFLVAPDTESPGTGGEPAASPPPAEEKQPGAGAERRDPVEEHRRTYLNVIKLVVDVLPDPRIRITAKKHPATISKYSEEREIAGDYYLTKQGVLLCELGPCTFAWTVKFIYTDESGRPDAFMLQCSATVFGGMAPGGTGKSRLDWCINGDCKYYRDLCHSEAKTQLDRGRYTLYLAGPSVIARRADIAKEVADAGRKVTDY